MFGKVYSGGMCISHALSYLHADVSLQDLADRIEWLDSRGLAIFITWVTTFSLNRLVDYIPILVFCLAG